MKNKKYTFEETAKQALREDYEDFASFFADLVKKSIEKCEEAKINNEDAYFYVVLLTRRCNALFSAFFNEIILKNRKKYSLNDYRYDDIISCVENHFITDNALLNNAHNIAKIYKEKQVFPKIIIVDELLIHGRALNTLLSMFERTFLFHAKEDVIYLLSLKDMISENIKIKVYAQNEDRILLNARFSRSMSAECVYNVHRWRKLSQRFGELISSSCHNNVSCSLDIVVKGRKAKMLREIFNRSYVNNGYEKIGTVLYHKRINNYIYGYPSIEKPKMLFDLRWKCNLLCKQNNEVCFMMVPSILRGDIKFENAIKLYNMLFENVPSKCRVLFDYSHVDYNKEGNIVFDSKLIIDTNDLFMNYLLLRRLYNLLSPEYRECIKLDNMVDKQTMVRQWYKISYEDNDGNQLKNIELRMAFSELLKWVPSDGFINECMETYFNDSEFLWNAKTYPFGSEDIYSKKIIKQILKTVRDSIYGNAIEGEKAAYYTMKGMMDIPELSWRQWGYKPVDIVTVIKKTLQELGYIEDVRIIKIILALIIHELDEGTISMLTTGGMTYLDYANKNHWIGKTVLKAGEQALYIKPQRYMLYIPLLAEISNYCQGKLPEIKNKLEEFLKEISEDSENLANELYEFMVQLNDSKQDIRDWNFDLVRSIDTYDVNDNGEVIKAFDSEIECLEVSNTSNVLLLQFLSTE